MSIRTENLTKMYGDLKALNNVSINIDKGEIVGLLGPNGAGKSTLIKMITGYLLPTSGNIYVDDHDVLTDTAYIRSSIGYLSEVNPLYYDMYVREFLSFICGCFGIKKGVKERVNHTMELTGLSEKSNKYIKTLSKGYKQRVGIAQALIHDPKVLILDEPTSGLDPNQIIEIRELIKNAGKDKTVLLSTHIMQEVEAICSRVIIIDKGNIVADDKTKNLEHLISGPELYIVEFEKEIFKGELEKLSGVKKAKLSGKNIWEIESERGKDVRKEIFEFGVNTNNAVLSMTKGKHSIEELFQKLTTK